MAWLPKCVNPHLVQQVITAERLHIKHQAQALQAIRLDNGYATYDVANTTTIRCPPEPDGKMNHTVGFGMSGSPTQADLLAIEQTPPDGTPELYVCEYAHDSAWKLLRDEGYAEIRSISHFVRDLSQDLSLQQDSGDVIITKVPQAKMPDFIAASVDGFRDGDRRPSLLALLAESAAYRTGTDTMLFFATIEGSLVGSAGLACLTVDEQGTKIGNLYIDSTLPGFRGRGVHQVLLKARLQAAEKAGCRYAIATAKQGSGSARNIQKAGLEPVFDSRIFGKKPAQST